MKFNHIAFAAALALSTPAFAATETIKGTSNQFGIDSGWSKNNPFTALFDLRGFTQITSALLSVTAYDVDADADEIDLVKLNGKTVGFLAGEDEKTITTTMTLGLNRLVENAVNTMTSYNIETNTWSYSISSASLTVTGTKAAAVPGPEAGAGLGAFALGAMALWIARRRKELKAA